MTNPEKQYHNSFSGKGVFPPKYAFTLLISFRNIFLSPKKLIQRLELQENHRVLEIGPGPGYFSLPIARILKKGKLILLDIQQEMLDMARRRMEKRKITNIEYEVCDGKSIALESKSFDRIFMVTVIGEIDNKDLYLKEINRILKDDGILSISELAGDPDKLSQDDLEALVTKYGFQTWKVYGSQRNYTMNFTKSSYHRF